jgi:hypothetical protein
MAKPPLNAFLWDWYITLKCFTGEKRCKQSPSPLWAYYYFLWIPNQLQIIYHLMINGSLPCPFCVWGPPGLLAVGSCCWVMWGLRSLNAAFPCWSCLSYFRKTVEWVTCEHCLKMTRSCLILSARNAGNEILGDK